MGGETPDVKSLEPRVGPSSNGPFLGRGLVPSNWGRVVGEKNNQGGSGKGAPGYPPSKVQRNGRSNDKADSREGDRKDRAKPALIPKTF